MHTLGIDLASQASNTAACLVEWQRSSARITDLRITATDDDLIQLAATAASIGIDAPFGWPDPFVRFLANWHDDARATPQPWSNKHRDELRYRMTDIKLSAHGGRRPLSVSSDLIALPAMRCAGLLGRLGVADRSGSGRVMEVYPAAALRAWELPDTGYKGPKKRAALADLVRRLLDAMPYLEVTPQQRAMLERSDDAFDALVSALVARAAKLGHATRPAPEEQDRAEREGWIAVPTAPVVALLG